MKKIGFISLFFIFSCSSFVFAQKSLKATLIVNECQKYIPNVWCEPQSRETIAYHFQNGGLKNREVLMTGNSYPFEFHFSRETDYVYQNRYLISDGGDVFDYDRRKIIYRNNGGGILTYTANETIQNLGVVKAIGDRLIVKLAVSNAEATNREGFYVFNLQTNKFNKIIETEKFPPLEAGNFSPNEKMIAVIERMKLVFYTVDKKFNFKKMRSVSLGYAAPTDEYEDRSEEITVVWADDRSVLTENKSGMIVKVNVKGTSIPILKPKKNDSGKLLEISKDRFGNFFVSPCGDRETCLMNLQTHRLKVVDCYPLGNGFSAAPEKETSNKEYRQFNFFYKSAPIGKNPGCYNVLTDGDYLAVQDKDKWGDRAEVKVWNAVSRDWTNIKINWHNYDFIVGWIKGK